jgi:hypothetical protein
MFYLDMDSYLIQTLCNARLIQAFRLQAYSEASINQAEVHASSFLQKGTGSRKFHPSVAFSFLVTTGGEGTFASLLRCRFIYFFFKLNDLCTDHLNSNWLTSTVKIFHSLWVLFVLISTFHNNVPDWSHDALTTSHCGCSLWLWTVISLKNSDARLIQAFRLQSFSEASINQAEVHSCVLLSTKVYRQ